VRSCKTFPRPARRRNTDRLKNPRAPPSRASEQAKGQPSNPVGGRRGPLLAGRAGGARASSVEVPYTIHFDCDHETTLRSLGLSAALARPHLVVLLLLQVLMASPPLGNWTGRPRSGGAGAGLIQPGAHGLGGMLFDACSAPASTHPIRHAHRLRWLVIAVLPPAGRRLAVAVPLTIKRVTEKLTTRTSRPWAARRSQFEMAKQAEREFGGDQQLRPSRPKQAGQGPAQATPEQETLGGARFIRPPAPADGKQQLQQEERASGHCRETSVSYGPRQRRIALTIAFTPGAPCRCILLRNTPSRWLAKLVPVS